jgi:hypothetical protein
MGLTPIFQNIILFRTYVGDALRDGALPPEGG